MRRKWAAGLAAFLFVVGLAPTGIAFSQDRIIIALDFIPLPQHSAMFAAQEKGYYARAGISPQITRGAGSGDTLKRVAEGSAHFGLADTGTLVVARSRGTQVKSLGVFYARAPFVIYTVKGSGIKSPKDLEGRSIGMQPGNATYVLFPALAFLHKVDETKVKWVNLPPASLFPALLAGKIDGMVSFVVTEPVGQSVAAKEGKEIFSLYYADWGLNIYSNGMVARDDRIREQEDLVRRFVDATIRAHAWAAENPDEAVDVFVKLHPEASRDLAGKQWMKTVELMLSPEARQFGLGYMTAEKVKLTRDVVTQAMKLGVEVPVEDIYTVAFLPKVFVRK